MRASFELSEEEYSPKLKRRCLPGSPERRFCSFGITEGIGALIASSLASAGVGSATAGIIGTGLADAAIGAGASALTGGNPLIGAATGGLGGLGGGLASNLGLGSALGIGTSVGNALGGAAGGALGSAITGGDPLTGALSGGALGYGYSPVAGPSTPTPAAGASITPSAVSTTPLTGSAGGGSSAISSGVGPSGAPLSSGVGALPTPDLTSTTNALGLVPKTVSATGAGVTPLGVSDLSTALPTIAAPATSSVGNVLDKLGGSLSDSITKNPLQALTMGLGVVQGNQRQAAFDKTLKQVQGIANTNTAQGTQLESYLTSGQLPAGLQANVDAATHAAKTAIRSKYAQLGLSGSTMEQQDLNAADRSAALHIGQLASQLYTTGLDQTKLTSDLLTGILQAQGGLADQSRNAIANYAGAISGGPYATTPRAA